METHRKHIVFVAAIIALTVAVIVLAPRGGRDAPDKRPPVQTAGQLDPTTSTPISEPVPYAGGEEIGSEEFFLSLAAALMADGFGEDYISAVTSLYAGSDPRDFLGLEAQGLAGQLSQHMQDGHGFYNVTTEDAAALLETAHSVYSELQ